MNDDEIFAAVVAAIQEETADPSLSIKPEMTANDVPGWDSLAHTRILLNIGDRLGVTVDIEATYRSATIGDLVPIIRQAL